MLRSTSLSPAGTRVLWLVRRGESTWNSLGLAQGHRDEARLTPWAPLGNASILHRQLAITWERKIR
jgi:broad specificity phosphatase PhoE